MSGIYQIISSRTLINSMDLVVIWEDQMVFMAYFKVFGICSSFFVFLDLIVSSYR